MSHLTSKKIELAERMYNQNGNGGKAPAPLNYPASKGGKGSILQPDMVGQGGKGKAPKVNMVGMNQEFLKSYKEANAKRNRPMKNAPKLKASQKGAASLNSIKKDPSAKMRTDEDLK